MPRAQRCRWYLAVGVTLLLAAHGAKNSSNTLDFDDAWDSYVGIHTRGDRGEGRRHTDSERTEFARQALKSLRTIPASGLPQLDDTYAVSEEQRAFFLRFGFVLLRGVLSAEEIGAYREPVHLAMHSDTHYLARRPGFIRAYNLWEKGEAVARLVLSRRFGRIAADLLGAERVRLYQDQTFFKGPGDGPSPPHQDMNSAPFAWQGDGRDAGKTLGIWVPLTAAQKNTGALGYVPGSHRTGKVGRGYRFSHPALHAFDAEWTDPERRAEMERMAVAAGMPPLDEWQVLEGVGGTGPAPATFLCPAAEIHAGDVLVHDGWTIHAAPGHSAASDTAREAVAVQYFVDGMRRGGQETPRGLYLHDSNSLQRWADDVEPGQTVVSSFVPVVYSREGAEAAAAERGPSAASATHRNFDL